MIDTKFKIELHFGGENPIVQVSESVDEPFGRPLWKQVLPVKEIARGSSQFDIIRKAAYAAGEVPNLKIDSTIIMMIK